MRIPRNIEDEFTADEFEKAKEQIATKMSKALNEQYEKVLSEIYSVTKEEPVSLVEILESLTKFDNKQNEICSNKNDISKLKKRIKYCKNPMEKKKLEQELNLLYKKRKRKK